MDSDCAGAIVASDECYMGLGWDDENPPVSILDPRVTDGDNTGLIAMHSLSKSANMASYRAGFFAGDNELILGLGAQIAQRRRELGIVQQQLADAAHISRSTLHTIEHGGAGVRWEKVTAVAEALGLEMRFVPKD